MGTVNLLMPTRYLVNLNLKFPQMMNDQKVFWKHLDKRKEMRLGEGGLSRRKEGDNKKSLCWRSIYGWLLNTTENPVQKQMHWNMNSISYHSCNPKHFVVTRKWNQYSTPEDMKWESKCRALQGRTQICCPELSHPKALCKCLFLPFTKHER